MDEEDKEIDEIDGSYNASDAEQVAKKRRASGKKRKSDEDIVKTIMSTQPGRAWILSILESCHIFAMSYTGEALSSAFNEGERNVGLKLLATVTRAAPDEYALMLKEKKTDA